MHEMCGDEHDDADDMAGVQFRVKQECSSHLAGASGMLCPR